ncbi:unnamed protein product [Closterium sp. NIES-53]
MSPAAPPLAAPSPTSAPPTCGPAPPLLPFTCRDSFGGRTRPPQVASTGDGRGDLKGGGSRRPLCRLLWRPGRPCPPPPPPPPLLLLLLFPLLQLPLGGRV